MVDESVAQQEFIPALLNPQRRELSWQQYDGCYGDSQHVRELRSFIQRAGQQEEHPHELILLTGESGMRLEQCARALHQASLSWAQPFLAINARKLSDEDLHGLLFGNEAKQGLLSSVTGGTIFLNELTQLSPVLQQRLAVYVEERMWRRERAVQLRLVLAADIQNEERSVKNRIAYGMVEMLRPHGFELLPLRERRADIPAIARQMLQRLSHQRELGEVELALNTEEALLGYDWPQNLDELEGVILSALEQLHPQQISEAAFPSHVRFAKLRSLPPEGIELPKLMDDYERTMLATALGQAGTSQTKAAKLLGLRVQTLNMKLKRLAEQGRPLL